MGSPECPGVGTAWCLRKRENAISGCPGKEWEEWGGETGKGRSRRGVRSRAGDCGGRTGLGPTGHLWETAERERSGMPRSKDGELGADAPAPARHRPGATSTL